MPYGLVAAANLVAGILFIFSLGGLSHQETARRGLWFGIAGITLAIITVLIMQSSVLQYILPALLLGGAVGAVLAKRVEMTAMPQLVAMLHSFVGLAAVLIGIGSYTQSHGLQGAELLLHELEIYIGVFVGAITFTGSLVAFGKLQGVLKSAPLLLPARHWLNLAALVATIILGVLFVQAEQGLVFLLMMTGIACLVGVHLVVAIGGADMPVVISMLNSYSGWAAAATGFMLSNDLLIITGALVGSSGAILSYIMCHAMNRSFLSVIFGGFGTANIQVARDGSEAVGEVTEITATDAGELLSQAKRVMIVPGYGMAVAHAQHLLAGITEILRQEYHVDVQFAIHPVAGRMPGHMNVLLAEADIPYDIVFEMEEINEAWDAVDVAVVIGANDIVNPDAQTQPGSPIYGMQVLKVWEAKTTIVLKRSMATGYAGVDNPLFYKANTRMLFGDAKDSLASVSGHFSAAK